MSMLSELLSKAQQLEVELKKEGTVLVGDADNVLKELLQNLEHEVAKEATTQAPATPSTDGVQKSSDLTG